MKRTKFLLLTVLMICSNWAWAFRLCDFEVDGIYYDIIGENEVAVTTKHHLDDDDDPYNDDFEWLSQGGRGGLDWQPMKNYTGDVYIPSSVTHESKTYRVTTISSQVFYNCDITSITIPNSVTKIEMDHEGGHSLFAGCGKLTSINVAEDNPIYDSRNGCNAIIETASNTLISGCRNTTIDNTITTIGTRAFYHVTIDNFTALPTSVYCIERDAFYDSYSDSFLIIPNSVKEMDGYAAFEFTTYKIINFSSISIYRDIYDYKNYWCPNGEIIDDCVFYRNSSGNVLVIYLGKDSNITLPENYKGENYSIGNRAFSGCSSLTSITIPNSATSIGEEAFSGCSSLTSITIPNSVTSIGEEAFYGCSSLTSITIPNSVTSIGAYAFYDCSSLKTVINCSNLVFEEGSTHYGYIAFHADKVYNFRGAENVEFVDDFIFYSDSNGYVLGKYLGKDSNITLPENYNGENYSIGESAFAGCTSLTNINIPNSVTAIGRSAFANCSGLTSLTIPNSVTTIGGSAFQGCSGLTSLTIPNSVNEIGDYAFKGCENLKTIINYSNMTFHKGYSSHGYIAYYADKVCNLPNAEFLDNFVFCRNPYNDGILLGLYLGNDTNIILPENFKGENYSIGDDAFYGCTSLTNINIPNSVTTIGGSAFFGCSGLTSLTIPNSVTTIGGSAFQGCSGLTSLTIPNSVNEIGDYAFKGCKNLKTVINCSKLEFSKGSTDNGYIAYYADKVYNYPNGEVLGDFIFYSYSNGYVEVIKYLGEDSNITLPENYKGENYSIGDDAFAGCTSLTNINIPNSVTSIGREAFNGCSSLTSINIPNSVTSIGDYAFYRCSSLTSITIPNSVTSIGEGAFYGCSSLTSINIPNSVTSIGNNAFAGCHSVIELCINGEKFPTFFDLPSVEKIILGENIKEAAEDAFNNYPVLNTLEFHCKRIYDWNFGTSRITDIIIGEEVAVIFGGAFEEVETLERLKVEALVPPIADDNTFSKLQYRMLEVSVPESAIEDYKTDEVWKKFSSIKGYVPTGIEEVVGETHHEINICINANGLSLENAEGKPVAVYTSNGQLVMSQISYNGETLNLPKGIYVVRISDTTKKVVLK